VGVAVEVKLTGRGAVPLVGTADAVQLRVQGDETITVPDCEHVVPSTEAVMVQE
jgi:hypothetical protein